MKVKIHDQKSIHIFLPSQIPQDQPNLNFLKFSIPSYYITKKIALSPLKQLINKMKKIHRKNSDLNCNNRCDINNPGNSIYQKVWKLIR